MKAKTALTLVNGDVIRTTYSIEQMAEMLAMMNRAKPGSSVEIERLTGHGTRKRVRLLAGTIFMIDEL